jgi:hypothetical protein
MKRGKLKSLDLIEELNHYAENGKSMADKKEKDRKGEKVEIDVIELDIDGTVDGAPIVQIASRLTWPQEKSEIIRKEGDEFVRTPKGSVKLRELLENVDVKYFSKRQVFISELEMAMGKGAIPIIER